MAQVRQTDKRTGIVYVYETEAVWDSERKQTRYGKRKLIGHIDRETGELVPNRPRRASAEEGSSRRAFFGTWALLSEAARESGLRDALVDTVGEKADAVLAIAGYMVSEAPMPLSRFPRWVALHDTPVSGSFDVRRCAELLASLGDSERDALCASLMHADGGDNLLLLETTSMASYEQTLTWPRCGVACCPAVSSQVNDDMEGLLDLHMSHMPIERMLPGGLFVAFVASVLAAWLQKRMRETELDRQYTLQGLLDEVETIERFTQEGRTARIGTVTSKQRAIFEKLGYSLPSD